MKTENIKLAAVILTSVTAFSLAIAFNSFGFIALTAISFLGGIATFKN